MMFYGRACESGVTPFLRRVGIRFGPFVETVHFHQLMVSFGHAKLV